jgi:uncharacterized membrane protein
MQFGYTIILRRVGFYLSVIAGAFTCRRTQTSFVFMFFCACVGAVCYMGFFSAYFRDFTRCHTGLAIEKIARVTVTVSIMQGPVAATIDGSGSFFAFRTAAKVHQN